MAKYSIQFKKSVSKDLKGVPNDEVAEILRRIRMLADDPRPVGSIKLSGHEKYRLRCGDYRILYEIVDRILTITVVKVGHRREVYR